MRDCSDPACFSVSRSTVHARCKACCAVEHSGLFDCVAGLGTQSKEVGVCMGLIPLSLLGCSHCHDFLYFAETVALLFLDLEGHWL